MWFEIENAKDIVTPAVLIYPERIDQNVARMLAMVESVDELCPHVKTHKTIEVLERFTRVGICQFKCATISELEMVASHPQATFALLAMQPVGPNIDALTTVASIHPKCTIATVVDNIQSLEAVAGSAIRQQVTIQIFLDLNNGMNRTGIRPNDKAYELYNCIADHDSLALGGLHVYDGHIHDSDFETRKAHVDAAMEGVLALRQRLLDGGSSVPRLIAGGTPSFPIHCSHHDRICSPGTPALWDAGYASNYPDLEFLPAAVLLTRVVSVIEPGVVCLDLGYKSVASEMQPPRVVFLNAEVTEQLSHSEEHLVVRTDKPLEVDDLLYALPWHICPTVARHSHLAVVENRLVVDQFAVTSRDRI